MAGIGAYDPRQQAHVSLTYKNQQFDLSASKSHELSQLYATNRLSGQFTSSRTGSAKSTPRSSPAAGAAAAAGAAGTDRPYYSRQLTAWESSVHPPFLDKNCRWEQQGLPTLVSNSPGQPLTNTGRLDGSFGPAQAPRAIAAVHAYNDVSPVLTTEFARDTDRAEVTWDATINKRGTAGVYTPADPPRPSRVDNLVGTLRPVSSTTASRSRASGDDATRKHSTDSFWQRNGAGSSTHLRTQDMTRAGDEVGKHAVAGTANCKLVGGKWRYIPRPVEGTHLFTDFYGRYDEQHCNYYGRTYHYLNQ